MRHLWLVDKSERISTSPLALGYPLLGPFHHVRATTACRSPALVFCATIHLAMKCSAPCSTVLRHSLSSWAAVVHRSALVPKALRSSTKSPHPLFFLVPHIARAPHHFSEHHALWHHTTGTVTVRVCMLYIEKLNASRPSEYSLVRRKNVKTCRWDHRL